MDRKTVERFWSKVEKTETCWEWRGAKQDFGYGLVSYQGKMYGAHRFSLMLLGIPIPKGNVVCHHCDNPGCVRPDHLFVGTQRENLLDCAAKGRVRHLRGDECHFSVLTEAAVVAIRARYAAGGITHQKLADEFGVTRRHMTRVIRGERWGHVSSSTKR